MPLWYRDYIGHMSLIKVERLSELSWRLERMLQSTHKGTGILQPFGPQMGSLICRRGRYASSLLDISGLGLHRFHSHRAHL